MIDSFRNIFAIPDLRKRVMFTFALLAVYRLGSFIPIPGIDPVAIAEFTKAAEGTVLGFLNLFSGGALGRMTVFALGIMPYISASIILQLLTVVWPYLEKLSKEGELGRRKITQYTRYGTVALAALQGYGIAVGLEAIEVVRGDVAGDVITAEHRGIEALHSGLALFTDRPDQVFEILINQAIGADPVADLLLGTSMRDQFGGGGHIHSAGFVTDGDSLKSIEEKIIDLVKEKI